MTLFDSDNEGRTQEERLRTKWITRYKGELGETLLLGDALEMTSDIAMEDIFPEDYYLKFAVASHEKKLMAAGQSTIQVKGNGLIYDRVSVACDKLGVPYNKGSTAKMIRNDLARMANATSLDPKTRESAKKLIAAVNKKFSRLKI